MVESAVVVVMIMISIYILVVVVVVVVVVWCCCFFTLIILPNTYIFLEGNTTIRPSCHGWPRRPQSFSFGDC